MKTSSSKIKQVIFVALTTYQLFIAEVYANYIKNCYPVFEVLIISVGVEKLDIFTQNIRYCQIKNLNGDKVHRFWQRLFYGGFLFSLSSISRGIESADNAVLFLFNDNEPITNKIMREMKKKNTCISVIIDEGIGTYAETTNKELNIKQLLRYYLTSLIGSPMQYKVIGDNKLIDCALVGNKELYDSLDKSKNQVVFEQNKTALFSEGNSFIRRKYLQNKQIDSFDILYLGQPFSEYGKLTEKEETYLDWLFGIVCKNYKVVIKPHPRDANQKYDSLLKKWKNTKMFDERLSSLPIECIAGGINMKVVISHKSSAGINIANLVRQICCIFTYKCGITPYICEEGDSAYSDTIFKSVNDNIFIPASKSEVIKIISKHVGIENDNTFDTQKNGGYSEIDNVMKYVT